MGLLSFFQRRNGVSEASAATTSGDEIAAARSRARRRLVGAAVLVMIGVIAFPLVFETQPRPIPVDIPIEIPRKEAAPGLPMPPPRPARAPALPSREEVITETPADAGKEVAAVASAPAPQAAASPAAAPKKPALAAARPAASAANEAVRARALLEGKEAAPAAAAHKPDNKADNKADHKADHKADSAADAGRFVVQVGAFADAAAAREMRGKVEKLGFKTYTQVVETASGSRIRVRAGPFASRDEADKALAKARAAGLTAVVLTL